MRPSQVRKLTIACRRARAVSPRPPEGSQPSCTAKIMISISPTQKVGSEKPRIEPAMMVLPAGLSGRSPAIKPERDAEDDRDEHRAEAPAPASPACAARISFSAGSL